MTLEGANKTMKRRGGSVKRDVSILERLQNIRAMLVEVRESLGDNSPVEYEAPIEAVADLIADVEEEAKREVVEVATAPAADEAEVAPEPRRRGRPRKVAAPEGGEVREVRRRKTKKGDESKELFPFYEQSLF